MKEYVIINDTTGQVVAKCTEAEVKALFPFLSYGDPIDYWENLIKTTCKWAGNSLYIKV